MTGHRGGALEDLVLEDVYWLVQSRKTRVLGHCGLDGKLEVGSIARRRGLRSVTFAGG